MAVLGVDGWKGSWVGAYVDDGLVTWRHGRFAELLTGVPADPADGDVLAHLADLTVVGVDIPIGLAEQGHRGCDLAARAALGRAASRAFLMPPRFALEAASLAEANRLLRAAGEPGCSAQTWGLRAAVLEVAASVDTATPGRVVEVHPELAFLHLAGSVLPPKKTARGVAARIAALSGWVDVLGALRRAPDRVPVDDALDALAAAWSAQRVATGTATAHPDGEARTDRDGRPMVIHA